MIDMHQEVVLKEILFAMVGPRIGEGCEQSWRVGIRSWDSPEKNQEDLDSISNVKYLEADREDLSSISNVKHLEADQEDLDSISNVWKDEDFICDFLSNHLKNFPFIKISLPKNKMDINWPINDTEMLRDLETERIIAESTKLSGDQIKLFLTLKDLISKLFYERIDFISYNNHRKIPKRQRYPKCLWKRDELG